MATELPTFERLLRALGDQTRLRILNLLRAGEVCVCHIHVSLGIPQSKASRHLAVLRRAGLVQTRRHGVWIGYRLGVIADRRLQGIVDAVARSIEGVDCCPNDQHNLARQALDLPVAGQRPCCKATLDAMRGVRHSSSVGGEQENI